MSKERILNPQIVHDAAAYLFWQLAASVGIEDASEAVIESAGQCLMSAPFTSAVLGQYGFGEFAPLVQRKFGRAVAAEAEYHALKGVNMDGVIYADDAQSGRSPSAQGVKAAHLAAIPSEVVVSGARIETIGRLCVRHPLPAVVFSNRRPYGEVLQIGDTSAALGFHLPMFLANASVKKVSDELFALTGIFHIPVPDANNGAGWGAVIQNSIRFINAIQFYGSGGKVAIEVHW